ncbi:hypothetical protein OG21DRAFT_930399 [Imleria badia]|nr:hypothetical protein OG21DRAFT_930399 [Imleria badia]
MDIGLLLWTPCLFRLMPSLGPDDAGGSKTMHPSHRQVHNEHIDGSLDSTSQILPCFPPCSRSQLDDAGHRLTITITIMVGIGMRAWLTSKANVLGDMTPWSDVDAVVGVRLSGASIVHDSGNICRSR